MSNYTPPTIQDLGTVEELTETRFKKVGRGWDRKGRRWQRVGGPHGS